MSNDLTIQTVPLSERVSVVLALTFRFAATLMFPPIIACILEAGLWLRQMWTVSWVCALYWFSAGLGGFDKFVEFSRLEGLVEVDGLSFSAFLGLLGWVGMEVFWAWSW